MRRLGFSTEYLASWGYGKNASRHPSEWHVKAI
jgi:hypothetical protein